MKAYREVGNRGQIGRIRSALLRLLREHGHQLEPSDLRLVYHGFNTTFRVQLSESDLAIRVNINSDRRYHEVLGELEFVRLVREDTNLTVPEPVPIFSGAPLGSLDLEGFAVSRPVVAYRWASGRHAGGTPWVWEQAGRALRTLQMATIGWELPEPALRLPLEDVLTGIPATLREPALDEVNLRANSALQKLKSLPRQAVHFDLHQGNIKRHGDQIVILDFDDAMMAWPEADVAQSLYYVRRSGNPQKAEEAFWRGYGGRPDLPSTDLEALVAGRGLLLLQDLALNQTADLIELFPKFLEVSRLRMEHFLRTGRFEPWIAEMPD